MILYHGSNAIVDKPKIIQSDRALDFGAGFYLTTDLEQAKRWAKLTTQRRKTGKAIVSVFNFEQENMKIFNILKFTSANKDWLEFVANNRRKIQNDEGYDVIIGPVADDNTMPVITLYLRGDYSTEEAINRLLTQRLKDQVVFKNEKSLQALKLERIIE